MLQISPQSSDYWLGFEEDHKPDTIGPMVAQYGLAAIFGVAVLSAVATKISRDLFWGLAALVFFLPFERIPTLELAGFTLKINHIVGGLLIVFFILDLLFNKRKLKPNPAAFPVTLFATALILSLATTTAGIRSVVFLLLDLFVIMLFLIIPQLVDTKAKFMKLITVLLWSVGVVVVFGLYQFGADTIGLPKSFSGLDPGYSSDVFGFPRVQAFSREPLYLANYLLIPLGAMAGLMFAKAARPGLLPLALLTLLTFILTLSRGAFVAAAVAAVFLVIVAFRKIVNFRTVFWGTTAAILAVVGFNTIFNRLNPDLKERFLAHATVADYRKGESTQGRLNAFTKAIDAFNDAPITGIGPGGYGMYVLNYPNEPPSGGWFIVNNQYLELLAETGIIGLTAFLFLVVVIISRSLVAYLKTNDSFAQSMVLGLTAVFIGTLVQYNFFSTVSIIHIWVLMGLIVAAQNLALNRANS